MKTQTGAAIFIDINAGLLCGPTLQHSPRVHHTEVKRRVTGALAATPAAKLGREANEKGSEDDKTIQYNFPM
jgi:hypothetical protein